MILSRDYSTLEEEIVKTPTPKSTDLFDVPVVCVEMPVLGLAGVFLDR